jgi:hypothetical protein
MRKENRPKSMIALAAKRSIDVEISGLAFWKINETMRTLQRPAL